MEKKQQPRLNAYINLVLVSKDITSKYGRTRSKGIFSTIGTLSLKWWILSGDLFKLFSIKS